MSRKTERPCFDLVYRSSYIHKYMNRLTFKARSHVATATYLLLNMRFYEIVHTVRWVWMQFVMYTYCNCTLQLHRIGMEPIHVPHRTQKCMHAEQITPCEHFHKPTYNPFHFIKSHVDLYKSQSQTKKNASRAFKIKVCYLKQNK